MQGETLKDLWNDFNTKVLKKHELDPLMLALCESIFYSGAKAFSHCLNVAVELPEEQAEARMLALEGELDDWREQMRTRSSMEREDLEKLLRSV